MSTFDQFNDTPYQIKNEGEQISVKLTRMDATTGQITWNIPKNTNGKCGQDPAYNGILITIDQTPVDSSKYPSDSTRYLADPSADPNTHMGDKIGTALVVGFFADDKTTTSTVVTDLDPTKTYFVSAHALSNIFTYHTYGVHSYSVPYGDAGTKDTPATQAIIVGAANQGVELYHPTGFMVGETYTLDMILDNDRKHTFTFDGGDIVTYQDLINEWNRQAMLIDNPLQSPMIPNMGMYYYDASTQQLAQWDGTKHVPVSVFVHPEQPNIISLGDTWFNPNTNVLYEATSVTPITWTPRLFIKFDRDPTSVQCGDLWNKDGVMYQWTGSAWVEVPFIDQIDDPSLALSLGCSTYWFNDEEGELLEFDEQCNVWKPTLALLSETDPTDPEDEQLWFNDVNNALYQYNSTEEKYEEIDVSISEAEPVGADEGQFWYKPSTMELFRMYDDDFILQVVAVWHHDPSKPQQGMLWWNSTDDTLHQWDDALQQWKPVTSFYPNSQDPSLPPELPIGFVWTHNSIDYVHWDGSEWVPVNVIETSVEPSLIADGTYWYDVDTGIFRIRETNVWVDINPLVLSTDPTSPAVGSFWFNTTDNMLYQFNGTAYVLIPFSVVPLTPAKGFQYFDTNLGKLRRWNGYGWVDGEPIFTVSLSECKRYLWLETSKTGSDARVQVGYVESASTGYIESSFPTNTGPIPNFFTTMDPPATPQQPRRGGDGLQSTPSYAQMDVGTDGSEDERRELIDSIRHQLGYPQVEVELTRQQMSYAIDSALESLRKRSGMAYKRGFMFLDVEPRRQHYLLTDKRIGYNRIVEITELHRVTSAFLAHPEGRGLYGQMALQQLYSMGSFDLISYHLVSQYIDTMERMFASKLNFMWDEDERKLSIFKEFYKKERVLMEVAVERTEQAMIKDRYLKSWIEKYAMVMCRLMLSEIRGKFSSLPGAGGGVTLNAGELSARADAELMELYQQIDDYIVNNPEEYGGQIILG